MRTATIDIVKKINGELKCINVRYRYESITEAMLFIYELEHNANHITVQINTIKR